MKANSYNTIIVQLLTSPRFRIVRHLLLLTCVLCISAGNIWHAIDQGIELTVFQKYGELFLSTGAALGACYFNIYLLTPRLLLRNKWGWYFIALFGLAILLLFFFILLAATNEVDSLNTDNISSFHLFKGIINISSSVLAFFVLLAGTSTMILFRNWVLDTIESEELESATLQLELKLLENQINPHFLFNMLNSANIMVKKDPDIAIHIIGKLEEMLRYLMNKGVKKKVNLKEEITFLEDFLELENTRRDYFSYTISREGMIDNVQVAPLLFISFIENAVKHSQDSKAASYIHISFKIEEDKLVFICKNSIPEKVSNSKVGGLGLTNINRRLNLLYKKKYSLEQSKTDTSYCVKLELEL